MMNLNQIKKTIKKSTIIFLDRNKIAQNQRAKYCQALYKKLPQYLPQLLDKATRNGLDPQKIANVEALKILNDVHNISLWESKDMVLMTKYEYFLSDIIKKRHQRSVHTLKTQIIKGHARELMYKKIQGGKIHFNGRSLFKTCLYSTIENAVRDAERHIEKYKGFSNH